MIWRVGFIEEVEPLSQSRSFDAVSVGKIAMIPRLIIDSIKDAVQHCLDCVLRCVGL